MRQLARRAAPTAAVIAAVLAMAALRVHCAARAELAAARAAAAAGNRDEAVTRYGRAMRWYLPIGSQLDSAGAALRALADQAAHSGNPALALHARRQLRGALLGARWLGPPRADWLAQANQDIARALPGDPASRLGALRRLPGPPLGHAALALLLFLGFLAAAAALALELGRPAPPRARRAAVLAAASAATLLGWLAALATLDSPLTLSVPAAAGTLLALAAAAAASALALRPAASAVTRNAGAAVGFAATLAALGLAVAALRPAFF